MPVVLPAAPAGAERLPPGAPDALGAPRAMGYARPMREASDETLMVDYANGDMAAFETLYQRYRGPLYRYFLRQSTDPATANDLYQGCWEKVIAARRRYRPRAPFRAWLFRIAHNHRVDYHRARRPEQALPDIPTASSEPGPPDSALADERHARLRAAIAALPPEQREAVILKLESGLGVAEIGKITGAGPETAKSRLRYATRKLKEALQA